MKVVRCVRGVVIIYRWPLWQNQSGDLRGSGLPYGGCQRFEFAYLQLVNLADTKLYDSTQFFQFGGSIYDLSFMDVDKIHLFSSTLGWHSLKSEGRGSNKKRFTVVPRHPETRKGIVIDEMIRGVENKHRYGDSQIGKPFKLLLNPWAGKRQPGELKHLSS
ncbi:Vacuolar protein sorting-associated protein-like protein [Capsicum annuum]|nr:Vacuolar protein sorting-associated protein-like protein [Capsicum annuum]